MGYLKSMCCQREVVESKVNKWWTSLGSLQNWKNYISNEWKKSTEWLGQGESMKFRQMHERRMNGLRGSGKPRKL